MQSRSVWISISIHMLYAAISLPSEILIYPTWQNLLVNLLSIFTLYLYNTCKVFTFTFFSVENSTIGLWVKNFTYPIFCNIMVLMKFCVQESIKPHLWYPFSSSGFLDFNVLRNLMILFPEFYSKSYWLGSKDWDILTMSQMILMLIVHRLCFVKMLCYRY